MVGHGSRDAAANEEFEQLVAHYRRRRSELELRHGYIELASPLLADALAEIPSDCTDVTLLPLFLFAAGHVKHDIPLALADLRRRRPDARYTACRELGVHPALVKLAIERAGEVVELGQADASRTALIVVGRGSSDPDANDDFCRVARLIGEARPFASAAPSFIAIARPRFEETLELVARSRPERLLVIPYLLFGGRLLSQLRKRVADFRSHHPWTKTAIAPQLGVHERLMAVLDERLEETRNGRSPSPRA